MSTNQYGLPVMLSRHDAIEEFLERVDTAPRLALDTEFLRIRTYYPQLCLVQLATNRGDTVCIDPLEVDAAVLGNRLRGIRGELVVHAAGQDLEVLDTVLGYRPDRLFDTQIAAAMMNLGDQISYAALVRQRVGIELAKQETRTDWCRRPLTDAQLAYARDDVAYLCELAEGLCEDLSRDDKLAWFEEECRELVTIPDDPDAGLVARFKGGAAVAAQWQPLLRDLILFREEEARRANLPREWVAKSQELIEIARARPRSRSELATIVDWGPGRLNRLADGVLGLLGRARAEPGIEPIWEGREPPDPASRSRLKRLQATIRQRAQEAGVSAALLASRGEIQQWLRGRASRLDRGWRRELLGDVLNDAVRD